MEFYYLRRQAGLSIEIEKAAAIFGRTTQQSYVGTKDRPRNTHCKTVVSSGDILSIPYLVRSGEARLTLLPWKNRSFAMEAGSTALRGQLFRGRRSDWTAVMGLCGEG
jgi:hypothetical protein